MLSGVAMDYTLFLLSAAWATYDRTGDPQQAMPTALRTSGRVVVAAAGVMVAVFLAFALSGPLASKEMGIILPSSSTRCSSGSSYCPSSCG
jgi:RND superfamily putative drug exporter